MTNRREFLSAAAVQAAVPAPARKKPISNGAVAPEQAHASQFPQGVASLYLSGPTDQLKDLATGTWRIKPGRSPHDIHQHPEEELLIFTEGSGEIVIAGVKQPVKPGSVMYCAANIPHGVFNGRDSEMLFYFIKWRA
ncbi:MAG TPA: cupin domain-containing protein [Bryobacteraceae bacterium]